MRFFMGMAVLAGFLGLIAASLFNDFMTHRAFLAPVQGEVRDGDVAQAGYAEPVRPGTPMQTPSNFQGPVGQPRIIGPSGPPPSY